MQSFLSNKDAKNQYFSFIMKILSLIDSLIAAGAERMAVNIANGLSEIGIESHLCATHSGGPLEEFILPDVKNFILGKKSFRDFSALFRLRKYVKINKIDIIHAHSSSLYWAVFVKCIIPRIKVVWHDHFGFSEQLHQRDTKMLRFFVRFVGHIFVVNDILQQYALYNLKKKPSQVSFLANFADIKINNNQNKKPDIPDLEAYPKIVCLANLRKQKDHDNLLDAFAIVVQKHETARLYLVGGHFNDEYYHNLIKRTENEEFIKSKVHILGSRNDVAEILSECQIGVLSSVSEGLPVSLLEYGLSKLAVVCTDVGDCSLVLDGGRCGKLVPPNNSATLAKEICYLLENKEEAENLAKELNNRVLEEFSKKGAIEKIMKIYNSL
ncbi:MAG: glycosyltransferase [Marinilabiliaceae bacterium]|nr:glycosyltransferase [Marinilabiliaceae bacterium]